MNEELERIVKYMMNIAENEIEYEHCNENFEQILEDIKHDYDIIINEDTQITMELIDLVVKAIIKWQVDTKNNY